jgi:hypothetical protein
MKFASLLVIILMCGCLAGCASYATPGRAAAMELFGATAAKSPQQQGTDPWISTELNRKPMATFPAAIAMARVQAPGYWSYSRPLTYGQGQFTVVTSRDVESDQQLERLEKLPMLRGLAPLNRLVIPSVLQTDADLRTAAAKLRADILLVYTLDTRFEEKSRATPLAVVTLGAAPTDQMYVACTASAALLDTRSGYVYGLAEATERREAARNAWTTEMEIDRFRLNTERVAFESLVEELQKTWKRVVRENATASGVYFTE